MTTWKIPEPPQYLEPQESRRMIDSVLALSIHPERDYLLLETLWQSAGRISEVLSLTPERIGDTSLILPNLKQKKDAVKETIVSKRLCDQLKEFCQKHEIPNQGWVFFGNRKSWKKLDTVYVWRLVTKISAALGIRKLKKAEAKFKPASCHHFRHGSAMAILEQTGSTELVQRQLGHSSIMTTQVYAILKGATARKQLSQIDWSGKGE